MLEEDSMVFGRDVHLLRERNPNGPTILADLRLAARRPIRSWRRRSRPGHHSVVDSQRNPSILSWCKKPGVHTDKGVGMHELHDTGQYSAKCFSDWQFQSVCVGLQLRLPQNDFITLPTSDNSRCC